MRILLLGATGNLGSRLVPSLLSHNHTVLALVRSPSKLSSLLPSSLLSHPNLTVVEADATSSSQLARLLREHEIEGIMNTAGTRVKPWEEFLLPKIARSVVDAAGEVGRERGRGLRVWCLGGMGLLDLGEGKKVQDLMPNFMVNQHQATYEVLLATPTTAVRWSILAVALMYPLFPEVPLMKSLELSNTSPPPKHDLILTADKVVGWNEGVAWWQTVLSYLPFVGSLLNVMFNLPRYKTYYEEVADMLAEDFERNPEGGEWVGKRVGMIDRKRFHSRKEE